MTHPKPRSLYDKLISIRRNATAAHAVEVLDAYLHAQGEAAAQCLLNHLISSEASAVIKRVLQHRLHFHLDAQNTSWTPDAEDLYCDIVAELIRHLRGLKAEGASNPIRDFHSYVAGAANNACHDFLRRKYPQRASLKNKLRYLLSKKPEFALWEERAGEWLCGFAEWREQGSERRGVQLNFEEARREVPDTSPVALLTGIFQYAGAPVELNALVALVAEIWGVRGQPSSAVEPDEGAAAAGLQPDSGVSVENRFLLQQVWREICQLPLRQRIALIFNLRDPQGGDVITLILETRTATIPQVAAALEMSSARFLQLWDTMPLDDLTTAEHLGVTRPQVIKLRRVARERLRRRLNIVSGWLPSS